MQMNSISQSWIVVLLSITLPFIMENTPIINGRVLRLNKSSETMQYSSIVYLEIVFLLAILSIKQRIVGKYFIYGGDCMGKISDKDSYKNMKTAAKSSKFFIDKQAPKKPKKK